MNVAIASSILSADVGRLADEIATAAEAGADLIHVDVMDGRFVPPITFGPNVVAAARRVTELPLDVHLMIEAPERFIDRFADAGASILTLHAEATTHVQRHLSAVRERGLAAGLALNPSTPLAVAEEVVTDLDVLLIMTVNPGYGGQRYLPASTSKISRARALLDRNRSGARLEVDGGIGPETIAEAHGAGADTFAVGSAIFAAPDPRAMIHELRRLCAVTV